MTCLNLQKNMLMLMSLLWQRRLQISSLRKPIKIKKENASDQLNLTRTPDILQWLGDHKREDQSLIGFAMETEDLEKNAGIKLEKKNLDWICANSVSGTESGFQADTNNITLINKTLKKDFNGPKQEIAVRILREIFDPEDSD